MNTLAIGDKVEIVLADDAALYQTQWWPKKGTKVTGTIQKFYKNGKVAVAVHQLKNQSEDGCHTLHFDKKTALNFVKLS
jgi:hypothetical protein